MFSKSEFEEIKKICNERKITPEKLLEEKVAPFKEKISNSQGQLIGALTRGYKESSFGMNPTWYSQRETLYTGLITSETSFPSKGEMIGSFLLGVDKSHSLELDRNYERDFYNCKNNCFFEINNLFGILYFINNPPVVPEDSYEHGCFGSHSTVIPTKKPRLELYIGDKETIPFLENNLEGWRYVQLQKLLSYYIPITEKIGKKIENEQLEIFDKMRVVESNKSKSEILNLLQTAIKRNYHENGKQIERKLDEGVIIKIDLKEFFSKRKELLEL